MGLVLQGVACDYKGHLPRFYMARVHIDARGRIEGEREKEKRKPLEFRGKSGHL